MGLSASDFCIHRLEDAEWLNELANDPDIRPTCGGDGKSVLDFTSWVAEPKNCALAWDQGAILFHWSAPHTYEVHLMVRPEGRGKSAYYMVEEAIDCMIAGGAELLWARVENNAVRHLTAHAGFTKCGSDTLDIGFGPVSYDLYERRAPCRQQ